MSFQHVYLSDLEAKGDPAIDNLIKRGIGENLSGDKFSLVHGDLITEVFNSETKRQAGPHIDLALVQTSMLSPHGSKLLTFMLNYRRNSVIQ